jgi:hydroxymethylpyrimidine kinase/phosphomethylpyrimidine kinase
MVYRGQAPTRVPDVLLCAGLDPSGGAGLIADVRVVSQLGARPVGVVTALTVQNTTGVIAIEVADAEFVGQQLAFLLTDIEVAAVKIGMIGSADVAKNIANALLLTNAPVVWDPVIGPTRSLGGAAPDPAMLDDALHALRPHLTLVTPNAAELSHFARARIDKLSAAVGAARALAAEIDAAVLVKGGHLGSDESIDVLVRGTTVEELRGPRLHRGEHVHGTGCALASAIAAMLAQGRDLSDACRTAKDFVAERIAQPVEPGRGMPATV